MNDTGSRRRWLVPAVIAAIVAIAGGAGLFYFFSGDEPEEVSLEAAVAAATSTTEAAATSTTEPVATDDATTTSEPAAEDSTASTEAAAPTPAGIEGTWAVDTSIGTFDFESASGSFVGFRIGETLGQGIGETEAVGRTGSLTGTLEIVGSDVTAVNVEADLSTLTTDESRRDSRARDALNVTSFPTATFALTEPISLADGAGDGDAVSATATGELTINGMTQPVSFAIEAQLVDDVIVVVASTEITFADYGVSVPSAGIVLSVDDFGTVEMQLLFSRS